MSRGLTQIAITFVVIAATTAPAGANVPLQGSLAGVTLAQSTQLGNTVSCRQYSISGADQGVNQNQCYIGNTACCSNPGDPTHNLDRCIRPYNTNAALSPGGYVCNSEATAAYNNDADFQTYYNLIDAEANTGTGDHIGFFAVEGQIGTSTSPTNVGDSRFPNCGGAASAVNCFHRADQTNSRQTPLTGTRGSFGPVPNQITSAGGFSPVPTVRVTEPGLFPCGALETHLTWDDPHLYAQTMKNGIASPVLGLNIYKNESPCGAPPDQAAVWSFVGRFALGDGAAGVCHPLSGDSWFAATVAVRGPGTTPFEIETYKSGNSQCTTTNGTAIRIVSLSARYAGRAMVHVNFMSGVEGGVQGYVVERARTPTGPFAAVSELIGATGDQSRYTFADRLRTGATGMVYYRIDIVKNDGTSEYSGTTGVVLPAPKGKRLDRD